MGWSGVQFVSQQLYLVLKSEKQFLTKQYCKPNMLLL